MQIEKFKTKFVIKGKYNEDVLALILKYEKKYWNKEKIEWSLPIDALQDFTNDIQNLSAIQLEVKDNKPYAILSKVADKVELKFAQFINQFDEFKAIEQVVFDKENRKLIVPEAKITEVLQVLKENKIDFMYDTRYSDKVDQNKLKVNNKIMNKATQTEMSQSIDAVKVKDVLAENKPKTSKRKLSPDGSSAKEGGSTKEGSSTKEGNSTKEGSSTKFFII